MGFMVHIGNALAALGRLLGEIADLVGADIEYPQMTYQGYTWDIIKNDGKRMTLRRRGTAVFTAFGRSFTYSCDWTTEVKRVGNNIVPIR